MLELFRQYTEGWKEWNKAMILGCLDSNSVITEFNGQKFAGIEQIKRWLSDWENEGNKVTQWEIKSGYYDLESRVGVFEWIFTCFVGSDKYHFKGSSIVKYQGNLIKEMREYQMEADNYYPYGDN
jgi:hypothetical protein